jgi:hypothetical protein
MKKRQARNEFRKKNGKDGRGHPTYIYARQGDDYFYIGITHAEISEGVKNIRLERNPNPRDKRPSYFRPKPQKNKRASFGKKLSGWSFSDADKRLIGKYQK